MRKQAGFIFSIRFVRLAFAILNLSFSAKYFGVSLERDVWLLALNAIVVFDVALWAPLNDTFRAKFLFIKEEQGEVEALQQTKSLLLFINLITILFVVFIMAFPGFIARLLAPSYEGDALQTLTFIIRLVAPAFLVNQVTKILISILNTYNTFIIPEVAGLITQVFTIVIIVALAPSIGIISLVLSYYAGIFLLLILLLVQLNKRKIELFKDIFKSGLTAALPFFSFSLPFFVPHFVSQVNVILEKSLATSVNVGAVSIIDYSRKFSDIPLSVLIGVLASLLVPVLSLKFASQMKKEFFEEFRKIYQFGLLVIALILGMLTGCSQAIVNFLYREGNITTLALKQISELAMFYSWSAFCVFLYQIYGFSLISTKRGSLFAIYGSLAQLFMIAVNLYFFKDYGIYIFPFSLGISHIIAAFIMSFYFPVRDKALLVITIKYSMLVVITCALMYGFNHFVFLVKSPILSILLNIILLNLILAVLIFTARLEERKIIQNYLSKMFSL